MSTFHEGELLVQERAGESHIAARNGRGISNRILPGAMPFLAQQRMLFAGSQDERGAVWASLLFGESGFVTTRDERTVRIDRSRTLVDPTDPFWSNLDRPVGLLAIDLATRKRYRMNGRVTQAGDILIDQAYANCPKYISRRIIDLPKHPVLRPAPDSSHFDIAATDVLFIASAHPTGGADISHRGGPAGFVEIVDAGTLRIPDYPGNGLFNTLGNLAVNPNAGLLFPDFPNGFVVQMTGRAEIEWNEQRSWLFHIEQSITRALPEGLTEQWIDASPYNP
jgi:predicted pyridoxine 5'-phosphate oxidase superfamily flavin-nucleotide-binding protein